MKTLGEIIKKYRQDHGLSMDGFSELSGLSKSYISMLEKNKRGNSGEAITPSLETIKSVANVLDMDFDELLKALDNDEEVKIGDDHLAKEKFETKEDAIEYLMNQKVIAANTGIDISKYSEEEIVQFTNRLLDYARFLDNDKKKMD